MPLFKKSAIPLLTHKIHVAPIKKTFNSFLIKLYQPEHFNDLKKCISKKYQNKKYQPI